MKVPLARYTYSWPDSVFSASNHWRLSKAEELWERELAEDRVGIEHDSRWPAPFPSPIAIVTTSDGVRMGVERVVAPVVVNRFPYVIGLSFCVEALSKRHYSRRKFIDLLEQGGEVAVQFLSPGPSLDTIMDAIAAVGDDAMSERIRLTGLEICEAVSNKAPIFTEAYLVYEAQLVKPGKGYCGEDIFRNSHVNLGSHRLYFFEIKVIQLREDIAKGKSQICWQSLPDWTPRDGAFFTHGACSNTRDGRYQKPYNARYRFPEENTIAFTIDCLKNGMAIHELSSQVVTDNNDSRWPCFFPSSCGMVTSFLSDGTANVMPCGSAAVVGRLPFTLAICVSYAAINERYQPRSSLQAIREAKKFGCGVPFVNDNIIKAITYSGNCSIRDDKKKLTNSGLRVDESFGVPVLTDLPIFFECDVTNEIKLGTHAMFVGEVRKIFARRDVTPENPVHWYPFAHVRET